MSSGEVAASGLIERKSENNSKKQFLGKSGARRAVIRTGLHTLPFVCINYVLIPCDDEDDEEDEEENVARYLWNAIL